MTRTAANVLNSAAETVAAHLVQPREGRVARGRRRELLAARGGAAEALTALPAAPVKVMTDLPVVARSYLPSIDWFNKVFSKHSKQPR